MDGVLPGGYWDGEGQLHRDFELAPLTGREEELLARGDRAESATLVTEVLSRCVRRLGGISPVPPEVVRGLLVADRHFLLLRLRRAALGDQVRASLVCPWPDCGERVSVEIWLADVPVDEAPHRAPAHTMTLSSEALSGADPAWAEVRFRLPNGADQEELCELLARNEAEALTLLLTRCILGLGPDRPPGSQRIAQLSPRARAEIEERMEALAPKVEQTVEARCAECGRTFLVPFDIQRFFFGELRADAALLYREVHHLAFHYHWSERDIMEMTRERRRTYIDVLSDMLEVENSGA
ncbi:hypothetical protein ABZ547_33470 [Streptomyces sparsogenes]|uniref:T4 family baseplate hub assembly chaperone n=1 Tax=Streptomyces sparsogenes TaxID=67365 RepID=UPI0033EBED40